MKLFRIATLSPSTSPRGTSYYGGALGSGRIFVRADPDAPERLLVEVTDPAVAAALRRAPDPSAKRRRTRTDPVSHGAPMHDDPLDDVLPFGHELLAG